jgi:hypothetical protein
MNVTIGRVVIFKTTEQQQDAMRKASLLGRSCNASDELPAIVVAVWSQNVINLKVLLDGIGDIWVTSVSEGDQPGQWHWPVIEK